MKKPLSAHTQIKVRFSEVDSLRIVWHGNFALYLEEGREAFGHAFGLNYLYVFDEGFTTPLVNMNIDYKKTVQYGDILDVETIYENTDAAKIVFSYIVKRVSDQQIVAKARTTQVFLNKENELCLNIPTFFEEWKIKWGIKER